MKRYNLIFILLFVTVCFAQSGFCSGSLSSRLNLQDASSVSKKANGSGSSYENSSLMNDPMLNSALGGMSNMIQGMTNNPYSMQEQQKAQMDYARQQQAEIQD